MAADIPSCEEYKDRGIDLKTELHGQIEIVSDKQEIRTSGPSTRMSHGLFKSTMLYVTTIRKQCCELDKKDSRHSGTVIRRKVLSPDEIANLLRELSENESDGGESSCSNLDSDEDIRSNESDCEESEESVDVIDSIPVNLDKYISRDKTEWIPHNSKLPGRFFDKAVIQQASRKRMSMFDF
ncbi:uncharacterized protein TNCV_4243741 [Trichonephila clavipes]|nr:uncharacterized protein TNCV_4243741 [Trichonephila clavipes]